MNKKDVKNYKSLGKLEAALLSELVTEELSIFSAAEVCRFLGCSKNSAYRMLYSLNRKGWIRRVTGGEYQLLTLTGQPIEDVLVLACNLIWPSYISFWTALNYYKLTEQAPRTLFLATTGRKREIKMGNVAVQFVQLSPKRFFGYTKVDHVCIAEKEKAIVDSLLFPRYVALSEVCKALDAAEVSFEKLVEYATRMGNASLNKRLGFLLEILNIKLPPKLLKRLRTSVGRGYSLLDPTKRPSKNYNKRWMLNVNVTIDDLLYWRKVG